MQVVSLINYRPETDVVRSVFNIRDYAKSGFSFLDESNTYFINDIDINKVITKPNHKYYILYDYFNCMTNELDRWFEYRNKIIE